MQHDPLWERVYRLSDLLILTEPSVWAICYIGLLDQVILWLLRYALP